MGTGPVGFHSPPVPGVVLLAALLAVGGCGTAVTTVHRESAVAALEAALSEARTAELAGRLWVDGRSTHPLAVVVIGESESRVGSERSWFDELRCACAVVESLARELG